MNGATKIVRKRLLGDSAYCASRKQKLYILGGFDDFKWLNDLHILDVNLKNYLKTATDTLLRNMHATE